MNPTPPSQEKPLAGKPELGNQQGHVVFPFDQEQFKDFIKSLLGSPQTITKTIRGSFEVNVDELRNLHQLIVQRVGQQNEGMLIQFKAKIIYSDDSSVELASAEELCTYNEIRPVVSIGVHLDWNFMVRFRDKDKPERQQIQVSIISSAPQRISFDREFIGASGVVVVSAGSGLFNIRIEHTARTWGADIEAMLSSHIETLCHKPHPAARFINQYSGWVGLTVGALLFLSVCFGLYFALNRYAALRVAELKAISSASSDTIATLNSKVGYVATFIVNGAWSKQMLVQLIAVVGGFVVSLVIGLWAGTMADTSAPSFVILTRESLKHREKMLQKQRRRWRSFAGSLLFAIATGILSHILFARYFN